MFYKKKIQSKIQQITSNIVSFKKKKFINNCSSLLILILVILSEFLCFFLCISMCLYLVSAFACMYMCLFCVHMYVTRNVFNSNKDYNFHFLPQRKLGTLVKQLQHNNQLVGKSICHPGNIHS